MSTPGGCSPRGFEGVRYPFKGLTQAREEVISDADVGVDELEKVVASLARIPIEETDNETLPPGG